MKGEDAKQVSKQRTSDQFLKNKRNPQHWHSSFVKLLVLREKNIAHTHLFHRLQIVLFFDSFEYTLQRDVFKGTQNLKNKNSCHAQPNTPLRILSSSKSTILAD